MTAEEIAHLRRLAEAATPGPWHELIGWHDPAVHGERSEEVATCTTSHDARYLAAVSPDKVLALLQEVERLRARIHDTEITAFSCPEPFHCVACAEACSEAIQ